jgi:hypothetical protein
VTNELDLLNFGKPNSSTYNSWYTAYNFLSYASDLLLVRAETAAMRNAVTSGTAVKIQNGRSFTTRSSSTAATPSACSPPSTPVRWATA